MRLLDACRAFVNAALKAADAVTREGPGGFNAGIKPITGIYRNRDQMGLFRKPLSPVAIGD